MVGEEQLVINLNWLLQFGPVILLIMFASSRRGKRFLQFLSKQPIVRRYVKPMNPSAPQLAQSSVAGFAQQEIADYWQGAISQDDITKILNAHEQLSQSDEQYSRKRVCEIAFNSVSSAPYRKTKMVLDRHDQLMVE